MKPSIERELEAIRQMVRDLEARLKNEREQLGHREVFSVGRRGEVPAPTVADRDGNRVLGVTGWVAQTGGSGSGGLSTVYTDGVTVGGDGSSTYPISASLLSATLDARIKNLSGTIDGRFNSLSYLSAVSHNSTLSGDGTGGNPLSAAPTFVAAQTAITASINGLSGTINSAFAAMFSGSQAWSQTANGTEGTTLTAVLPVPYPNTSYYAYLTHTSGTTSPVVRITNKTSASFQVVSTAPHAAGARYDFLTVTGGLGPVWDGSVLAVLSATIDAHFITLSQSIDSRFSTIGGGYLGKGVGASSFAAGSIIKRGPFLFGTFSGSSVDPLIVEGNVGSPTDWSVTGTTGTSYSQSGSILTLLPGVQTSKGSAAFRLSTNSGIDGRRLICEALVGGTAGSCADQFQFGVYDANEGFGTTISGIGGLTGTLGILVDVFNSKVGICMTGSMGNLIAWNATAETGGNDILKSTKYYRFYLDYDFNGAGSHVTMSLYRDNWTNTDSSFPGYIAQWIVAAPAWITNPSTQSWRFACGAWDGAVAGTFKVRAAFVQRRVPEWDLISILPHTPRIDWRIF